MLLEKSKTYFVHSLWSFIRALKKKRLDGFSLIELALVLMIVGVIASAIIKGQDLLELARVRSVMQDVDRYKVAVSLYQDSYQSYPGDDSRASEHFGNNIENGNGDGVISQDDCVKFWNHLSKAGYVSSDKPPSSRFGGRYTPVHNPSADMPGLWLRLGDGVDGESGLLTPKQAQLLMSKGDEGDNASNPSKGHIRAIDGKNTQSQCLIDNKLNLQNNAPVCVVYVAF
jgi:prepilin-type N-terminal cleavage/methylation domain-containing protein